MNTRLPDGVEWRSLVVALRAGAGGRKLAGCAATFGTPAQIGEFTVSIRAGAFRASLTGGKDVLPLVDHDPGKLLARTASGTLRLSEDARGLAYELDLPDTQLGHDVLTLAQRGDLGGMSFGFRATDEAWPSRSQRELRAVDLIEISVVQAFPAYSQTSVSARARALGRAEASALLRRRVLESL